MSRRGQIKLSFPFFISTDHLGHISQLHTEPFYPIYAVAKVRPPTRSCDVCYLLTLIVTINPSQKETKMESKNAMGEILAKCMRDEEFKARFVSDPKSVLKEFGVETPEVLRLVVVEDDSRTKHIVVPAMPPESAELSDRELAATAAGGGYDRQNIISNAWRILCGDW